MKVYNSYNYFYLNIGFNVLIVIPYIIIAYEIYPEFVSTLTKMMVSLYINSYKEKSIQLYNQAKRVINLRKYPKTASVLYEYYTQYLYAHLKIKDPKNIPPIYYESIINEMKLNVLPEDIQSGIVCLNMIDKEYNIQFILETLKRWNIKQNNRNIDDSTLYKYNNDLFFFIREYFISIFHESSFLANTLNTYFHLKCINYKLYIFSL